MKHRFPRALAAWSSIGALIAGASSSASAKTVHPAPELAHYSQILIDPLAVRYTEAFLADRNSRRHVVGEVDLVRIKRHFRESVSRLLGRAFSITNQPGPGVLRIDAELVDHVLDKSDWWRPARAMFRSPPRILLIAALRDSQTGQVLHRVGLDLRPRGDRLQRQSPIEYWSYMRQIFNRVAVRVRWAIEGSAASRTQRG